MRGLKFVCFLAFVFGSFAKTGSLLNATSSFPKEEQEKKGAFSQKPKNKGVVQSNTENFFTDKSSEKVLSNNVLRLFIEKLELPVLVNSLKRDDFLVPFLCASFFALVRNIFKDLKKVKGNTEYSSNSGVFNNLKSENGNDKNIASKINSQTDDKPKRLKKDSEKNDESLTTKNTPDLDKKYEELKENLEKENKDFTEISASDKNKEYEKLKSDYDDLQKKYQDLLKNNYPDDVVNLKNKEDGNKGIYFLLLILFTTSLTLAFYTRFLCIKNKRLSEENKNFSIDDCISTFLNTYLPRLESKIKIFEDENPVIDLEDKFGSEYKDVFEELAANKNKKFVKFLLKRVYDNLQENVNPYGKGNLVRNKVVEKALHFNNEFFEYVEDELKRRLIMHKTIYEVKKIDKKSLELVEKDIDISLTDVVEIEINKETFPTVNGVYREKKTGKFKRFERSYFEVFPTIMFPSKFNFYALPVDWGKYNEYFKVVLPTIYAKMYKNNEQEDVKKRIVEGFLYGKDDFEYYEDEEHEKIKEEEILERAKFLLIPLMYIDEIDKEYKEDFLSFMKEYIIKGNEGIFKKACISIPGAEEFCKGILDNGKDKNDNDKANDILNNGMSEKDN